jgi:3',5'-cyclic AMP phosphodiesterase CpdA
MQEFEKVLVIPDDHGRGFWKEFVKGHENEMIVFLGDYVDPYPHENISEEEALANLLDIIEFKKEHKDNVILLLGNHDCSYRYNASLCNCRYAKRLAADFRRAFNDNKELFQLAFECKVCGKEYIFSHAGVPDNWISNIEAECYRIQGETNVEFLNRLYKNEIWQLLDYLRYIAHIRGGFDPWGSCIWCDVREWLREDTLVNSNVYQVFGHTQLKEEPIITDKIACLDCRRGFSITKDGIS